MNFPLFQKIKNVTAGDSGKYFCQINQDLSNIIRKEVDLQVTRSAVITDMNETLSSVFEGQSATLKCAGDGFPKPEIKWTRENDVIMSRSISYR